MRKTVTIPLKSKGIYRAAVTSCYKRLYLNWRRLSLRYVSRKLFQTLDIPVF